MRVLTGVRIAARADDVAAIDARGKAGEQAAPFRVGADEARQPRARRRARRRCSPRCRRRRRTSRRVVLEDEHRRLARDAGDFAVDELVGDQIADDEHAAAAEAVDEREQALLAFGLAGSG